MSTNYEVCILDERYYCFRDERYYCFRAWMKDIIVLEHLENGSSTKQKKSATF